MNDVHLVLNISEDDDELRLALAVAHETRRLAAKDIARFFLAACFGGFGVGLFVVSLGNVVAGAVIALSVPYFAGYSCTSRLSTRRSWLRRSLARWVRWSAPM